MKFNLTSNFQPTGDQPEAISQLVDGLNSGEESQILLGVTGSGKTFTIANVIQQVQRPTLVLSHNKTLVSQLYGEFNQFFPDNAVEYFVSYYDYYQPEAYVSVTDTYIEKDLSINEEVEKLRLRTTTSLLSGRRDIIVVASVSCIFGLGNPVDYKNGIIRLSVGDVISRNTFLLHLVESLYSRSGTDLGRGNFRVRGEVIDIFPPYAEHAYRVTFFGDEVEEIEVIDPVAGSKIEQIEDMAVFPANIYVAPREKFPVILNEIQDELGNQVTYFESQGLFLEAKRLHERTNFDLEMIRELGYCSGIENYSRYLDGRNPGDRPFCLLDYFPDDFLLIIDESHATVSQVGAMYGGDRSRKVNLVDYGFRLPSALDNRPLNFNEFEELVKQTIYVSATPADYELKKTEGIIVEQIIRPTGLLDPEIVVRPSLNQIDDLIGEINDRTEKQERVLVTTLTKRMAEELSKYLSRVSIKCRYIHSEVDTLERVEILRDLRLGVFDVLIGVNLLREGLDLPEVSLVAILDADKEGFLRSERSLIQIAGRAARNVNGRVIMYADKVTDSMKRTIDDNNRKREKQVKYNTEHGITPKTILKNKEDILNQTAVLEIRGGDKKRAYIEPDMSQSLVADPVVQYMDKAQLEQLISVTKKRMESAAKKMEFIEAARLRDEMFSLQQLLKDK